MGFSDRARLHHRRVNWRAARRMVTEERVWSHSGIVSRGTVNRGNLRSHRSQVARKLPTVVDRVEEKPKEHVTKRGLPHNVSVHQEPGLLLPGRVIQRRGALLELFGIPLVRRDRFRHGRSGSGDVAHFSSLDELARIAELAGEEPYEISGARRARMRAIGCLIGGYRLHDTDELGLFGLEAFFVLFADAFHDFLLSSAPWCSNPGGKFNRLTGGAFAFDSLSIVEEVC